MLVNVLTAASHLQQLPGTVQLLRVLGGPLLHHLRHIAQPAREMEAAVDPTAVEQGILLDGGLPSHGHQQRPQAALGSHQPVPAATPSAAAGQSTTAPAVQRLVLQVPQQQQQQQQVPSAAAQPHQPPSPAGVKKTFYKRKLPCPPATEFSSTEGKLTHTLLGCSGIIPNPPSGVRYLTVQAGNTSPAY